MKEDLDENNNEFISENKEKNSVKEINGAPGFSKSRKSSS